MITTFQDFTSDDTEPRSRNRLTTRSLRDDEIRAIADANYRGDNPLRFDCVRLAALMFERAGYSISLSPEVSPLAVPPQPIVVGDLVVDVMHRTVRFGGRELDLKPREFGLLEILARHPGQVSLARTSSIASGRATMTATSAPSTSTSLASAAASVRG